MICVPCKKSNQTITVLSEMWGGTVTWCAGWRSCGGVAQSLSKAKKSLIRFMFNLDSCFLLNLQHCRGDPMQTPTLYPDTYDPRNAPTCRVIGSFVTDVFPFGFQQRRADLQPIICLYFSVGHHSHDTNRGIYNCVCIVAVGISSDSSTQVIW